MNDELQTGGAEAGPAWPVRVMSWLVALNAATAVALCLLRPAPHSPAAILAAGTALVAVASFCGGVVLSRGLGSRRRIAFVLLTGIVVVLIVLAMGWRLRAIGFQILPVGMTPVPLDRA